MKKEKVKFKRTIRKGMIVYENVIFVSVMDFDHSILESDSLTFEKRDSEPNVLYYLPTTEEKALLGIKGNYIKFKRMQ